MRQLHISMAAVSLFSTKGLHPFLASLLSLYDCLVGVFGFSFISCGFIFFMLPWKVGYDSERWGNCQDKRLLLRYDNGI